MLILYRKRVLESGLTLALETILRRRAFSLVGYSAPLAMMFLTNVRYCLAWVASAPVSFSAADVSFLRRSSSIDLAADIWSSNSFTLPASGDRLPSGVLLVPTFSLIYVTNSSTSLPPSYEIGSLPSFGKNLIVGYPETSNLLASSFSSVASTLAIRTSFSPAKTWANFSYFGVSCLQCPHQGA